MMPVLGKQILTMTPFLIKKPWPRIWRVIAGARLGLALCGTFLAGSPALADTHSFVTDPLTGVAMGGYDPVAYFTQDEAVQGLPEYALEWSGVPWYFVSAANRDAFRGAPLAYAPIFGGYGTMAVARGFLSAGNPRIYTIVADHLFLFYSTANREAFLLAPRSAFGKAQANWPVLSQSLVQNK